jgi:putative molybdopterin biosynthesis protein
MAVSPRGDDPPLTPRRGASPATTSPFVRDVPAARALDAWRSAREAGGCPARLPAERVGLEDAAGLVTAEPVWATRSSPPFDAAGMDGIAVRAADTLGASETSPVYLRPEAFDVVDTGDPMPDGRDAVVMREHVHYVGGPAGSTAELRAAVPPYQHVRSIGEDVSTAELLLPEGHRLRAVDLAAAAAAGATDLLVRRRPVVAVLPTGDEVRPVGTPTGPGEILDTNSLMLAAQAREAGAVARRLPIEPDDPVGLAKAVGAAVGDCDLLIIVAGSSAGRDDYTARVVAELGTLAVHGVAVRPGHPVVLGVVDRTPVLGAPGYPVSAALTFDIFAEPLLAELAGAVPRRRQRTRARLARKLASPLGMDDWVRVRLGEVGGTMVATPLPRGAGVLTSLVRADGLLVVPAGQEGHHPGDQVDVELLRGLDEISRTIVAIGSHDLVLDLAASALRADDPGVTLASSNVGSLGGLVALRDGLCHVAGSHLLDPATGGYTLPYIDRILGGREVRVVRLVHREQGLIVAPGNPLGLTGIGGLARPGVRYVNRQRGAGTRVLLDHELRTRGIGPDAIEGYAREEPTHLAVAAAVAAGRGDAGLGIMAAARAFGLDFLPVAREPYDLVAAAQEADSPRLAPLWALLQSDRFRAAVADLGGYDTKEMGRRIR